MKYLKTAGLVVVLLAIAFVLSPYVKIDDNTNKDNENSSEGVASNPNVRTYTSDRLGITFQYDPDQDGDSKPDTTVGEEGDKVFVYYQAGPMEQGQWVQRFDKDPNISLKDAIKNQFLANYSSADCYPLTLGEFYQSYGLDAPYLPQNIEEAVIAYPQTTDPEAPYWQNGEKCPPTYTLTNGINYFWMNSTRPDRYYFFNIGQYAIFSDIVSQNTWENTVEVK